MNELPNLAYSICPEDSGEVDIPKYKITWPFNNAEQNSSLKISIEYVLGNDRLGGGDWLPSIQFCVLKRALKLPASNQMSSIRSQV